MDHSARDLLPTDLQGCPSKGFSHQALKKEDLVLHRTFWTWRRFTGIVLILGGVLFQGSAWIPLTIGSTPLTDSKGTFIYLLPPQEVLGVVLHHQALWWWTNAFFMGSTIVTMLSASAATFSPLSNMLRYIDAISHFL